MARSSGLDLPCCPDLSWQWQLSKPDLRFIVFCGGLSSHSCNMRFGLKCWVVETKIWKRYESAFVTEGCGAGGSYNKPVTLFHMFHIAMLLINLSKSVVNGWDEYVFSFECKINDSKVRHWRLLQVLYNIKSNTLLRIGRNYFSRANIIMLFQFHAK